MFIYPCINVSLYTVPKNCLKWSYCHFLNILKLAIWFAITWYNNKYIIYKKHVILIITIYNADSQSKHGVSICKISAVGTYLHHHTSSLDRDVWRNDMTSSPQGHCEGLGASSNGRLSHEKVMKMLHLSLTWRKSYNNVWELTMAVFQRLRVVYCRFVNRLDIYLFICFVLCFYLDAVRFVRVLFRVNKNKPFQSVLFI